MGSPKLNLSSLHADAENAIKRVISGTANIDGVELRRDEARSLMRRIRGEILNYLNSKAFSIKLAEKMKST